MPGTAQKRNELHQPAVTPNQHMCGDMQSAQLHKTGMIATMQRVGKQRVNGITTKFTWG